MEESVALSPYGLRPAYLHDKNYLIKNYLTLIKQSIILLLNKKYIQKYLAQQTLSKATAPKRPLNCGKKVLFQWFEITVFLFCYMPLRFLIIRILQSPLFHYGY